MLNYYSSSSSNSSSCCGDGRNEGTVLFNDALNTFYLRLYGVRHMVKDHSDSEKGNPLSPHRLLFYMHHPTDRIAHTRAFVTPVVCGDGVTVVAAVVVVLVVVVVVVVVIDLCT